MNRTYNSKKEVASVTDIARWADSHNTDELVACAILAIASGKFGAEAIWSSPSDHEIYLVKDAMQEMIAAGDFPADEENKYYWGETVISL